MTPDRPEPSRGADDGRGAAEADAVLRAAADYLAAAEAIAGLLASDARDLDEIPGYAALEDRRTAALARLCDARATDMAGLVAKARVLTLRAGMIGVDADPPARGLAADLLTFAGG